MNRLLQTEEGRLFVRALYEAFEQKADSELSAVETHPMTPDAVLRIRGKLASHIRRRRRMIAAAIIAATLVLSGCAAYIIKEQFGGFFQTIDRDSVDVYFEGYQSDYGGECYVHEVSYVPDGYKLVRSRIDFTGVDYIWENADGGMLRFSTGHISVSKPSFDNEGTETVILSHNGMDIYRRKANDSHYVNIWAQDGYLITLTGSYELSEQEICTFVDGVSVMMTYEEYIEKYPPKKQHGDAR